MLRRNSSAGLRFCLLFSLAWGIPSSPAQGQTHGLWVWKSPEVLNAPSGPERLRDFCRTAGVNEVYVSYSSATAQEEEGDFQHLIGLLHHSRIRVEALLSSTDADEPGSHRNKLLERVGQILAFNRRHPGDRFDGIQIGRAHV